MPDVTVSIGGKEFTVACQAGEEPYLTAAAELLDNEAKALTEQVGRLPESRMLLMAGLMLADRTAAYQERAEAAEAKVMAREKELAATEVGGGVPKPTLDRLAELTAQAESIAKTAEGR